jgi:ABC-2 type transport system ATP-binding protein
VSFRVGAGETAALLGPNGSGKSTLIRCLVGFFSPTGGRVRIDGVDVGAGGPAARRGVGYLPEQVVLYPELGVVRYLRFVGQVKGLGGRALGRAVDEVCEQCGLGDVRDRPTGVLSKGYRQRVGIAQALIGSPRVLVLDEPTVGLDPVQAVDLRALIGGLRSRTILLSTHLLAEASQLCDRVVIIHRGRLLAEDTPAGLAARLGGGVRVVVRVEGPVEAVAAALQELTRAPELDVQQADGEVRCVVHGGDARALQRTVAARIVREGWTLREIREEAPTLEDLFVRLVR